MFPPPIVNFPRGLRLRWSLLLGSLRSRQCAGRCRYTSFAWLKARNSPKHEEANTVGDHLKGGRNQSKDRSATSQRNFACWEVSKVLDLEAKHKREVVHAGTRVECFQHGYNLSAGSRVRARLTGCRKSPRVCKDVNHKTQVWPRCSTIFCFVSVHEFRACGKTRFLVIPIPQSGRGIPILPKLFKLCTLKPCPRALLT